MYVYVPYMSHTSHNLPLVQWSTLLGKKQGSYPFVCLTFDFCLFCLTFVFFFKTNTRWLNDYIPIRKRNSKRMNKLKFSELDAASDFRSDNRALGSL